MKKVDIRNIDATDKISIAIQITKITDEAKVLARLNHPNIIKYFDSFHHGNDYCIVTELCEVCMPIDLLKLFSTLYLFLIRTELYMILWKNKNKKIKYIQTKHCY